MARRQGTNEFTSGEDDVFEITESQMEGLDVIIAEVEWNDEEKPEPENDEEIGVLETENVDVALAVAEQVEMDPFAGESPTVEMQLVTAASEALGKNRKELQDAAGLFGDMTASQKENMQRSQKKMPKKEEKKEDKAVVDPFYRESPTVEEQLIAATSEALGDKRDEFEDATAPFADITASQEENMAIIIEAEATKRKGEKNKEAKEERETAEIEENRRKKKKNKQERRRKKMISSSMRLS